MKNIFKRLWCNWSVLRGQQFPLERMLGKSFVPASQLPHRRLLELYERHGREGFDLEETQYYRKIVDFNGDLAESFGALPEQMDIRPTWWFMPWASLHKKSVVPPQEVLQQRAVKNINKLFDLYDSIVAHGYVPAKGGAISGFLLDHPQYGQAFNHIDGHHRMAVLDYLKSTGRLNEQVVCVEVLGLIRRDELLEQASCREGLAQGYFSERDAFVLFDHVFAQLPSS